MRAIFKAIKAFCIVIILSGLAVVLVPATKSERAMIAQPPERADLIYRRIAVGVQFIDQPSFFDGIASRLDVSSAELRAAVTLIANGADPEQVRL